MKLKMNIFKKKCPLCDLSKEHIWYQDDTIAIIDTLNKKGHIERIMCISKAHSKKQPIEFEYYAKWALTMIGKAIFKYTDKFIILQDKYSTIPDHWHICASEINPETEDYEQILETPFEVVYTK